MAKIIEFYIPPKFRPSSKIVLELRGQVIKFRRSPNKSA